jgi:hypothetical protein
MNRVISIEKDNESNLNLSRSGITGSCYLNIGSVNQYMIDKIDDSKNQEEKITWQNLKKTSHFKSHYEFSYVSRIKFFSKVIYYLIFKYFKQNIKFETCH